MYFYIKIACSSVHTLVLNQFLQVTLDIYIFHKSVTLTIALAPKSHHKLFVVEIYASSLEIFL